MLDDSKRLKDIAHFAVYIHEHKNDFFLFSVIQRCLHSTDLLIYDMLHWAIAALFGSSLRYICLI